MKILFQGDSITDTLRCRENGYDLGRGYVLYTAAELGYENPGKYLFLNRGIIGNRIVDLYARIKCDIINLKPDVMSILIGVNDVWHDFIESPNGVDADKFFKIYCMLIEEVKKELPDIKIMILEPYVLKAGKDIQQYWEEIDREVKKRAQMAKKVAEKYNLPFVPLQEGFDKLTKEYGDASYWAHDGVHPTEFGHIYIKNEWIKAFKKHFV